MRSRSGFCGPGLVSISALLYICKICQLSTTTTNTFRAKRSYSRAKRIYSHKTLDIKCVSSLNASLQLLQGYANANIAHLKTTTQIQFLYLSASIKCHTTVTPSDQSSKTKTPEEEDFSWRQEDSTPQVTATQQLNGWTGTQRPKDTGKNSASRFSFNTLCFGSPLIKCVFYVTQKENRKTVRGVTA